MNEQKYKHNNMSTEETLAKVKAECEGLKSELTICKEAKSISESCSELLSYSEEKQEPFSSSHEEPISWHKNAGNGKSFCVIM